MGLAEHIKAGAVLKRETVSFTTSGTGAGTVPLGSAYILLDIETNTPCRLRLYDSTTGWNNASEISRSFGDPNISASTSLIGDFSMSAPGKYTADPVVYAVTENLSTPLTRYRITPITPIDLNITTYTIEDSNVEALPSTPYSISNRRTLPQIAAFLSSSEATIGTLSGVNIPKTYCIVSASVSGSVSNGIARLRLYSTSGSLSDPTEIDRDYSTEPPLSTHLIVDTIITESLGMYFTPKIIGANVQPMNNSTSLLEMRVSQSLLEGESEIHYIMQNYSGVSQNITASLHVYSLED